MPESNNENYQIALLSLSIEEQSLRENLEDGIREGMLAAWRNLEQIRDMRLYRSTHGTFEEYCRDVWGVSRHMVNYRIQAAEVAGNLVTNGYQNILPTTERQTRPLTPLPPQEQVAAWDRAIEMSPSGKPTAAIVQAAVDEIKKAKDEYTPPVGRSTGYFEWYTPQHLIEAARYVMNGIDLDPASCEAANEVVKAERFFTKEDDGLRQRWYGRVWMNPPYAKELIDKFAEKFAQSYIDGDIDEGCVLVNNATETAWFDLLLSEASTFCLLTSRVKFWQPGNDGGSPTQGQVILYFGSEVGDFYRAFCEFGHICQVINPQFFKE